MSDYIAHLRHAEFGVELFYPCFVPNGTVVFRKNQQSFEPVIQTGQNSSISQGAISENELKKGDASLINVNL